MKRKKKLSLHVNRVATADSVETAEIIHPVVEVADAWEGLIEIKARTAKGVRLARVEVLESAIDDELVAAITAWQARHSHPLGLVS